MLVCMFGEPKMLTVGLRNVFRGLLKSSYIVRWTIGIRFFRIKTVFVLFRNALFFKRFVVYLGWFFFSFDKHLWKASIFWYQNLFCPLFLLSCLCQLERYLYSGLVISRRLYDLEFFEFSQYCCYSIKADTKSCLIEC